MKLPTYDFLAENIASDNDINAMREQIEQKPLIVEDHAYDCKPIDFFRMEVVGTAFLSDKIDWRLADNASISLYGSRLLDIRKELLVAYGRRANLLHQIAQDFKSRKYVTLRDIQPENWIT